MTYGSEPGRLHLCARQAADDISRSGGVRTKDLRLLHAIGAHGQGQDILVEPGSS